RYHAVAWSRSRAVARRLAGAFAARPRNRATAQLPFRNRRDDVRQRRDRERLAQDAADRRGIDELQRLVRRGRHDHRRLQQLRLADHQITQDVEAGKARQREIEQHAVVLSMREPFDRDVALGNQRDGRDTVEHRLDACGDDVLVFDDEHAIRLVVDDEDGEHRIRLNFSITDTLRAMCLIALAHRASEKYPFVLAANRDEDYERDTRVAQVWEDAPEVVGGRDALYGGSWLAIARNGRFAAVTNLRGA